LLLTPRHSAYVKISEGCNHPCSFCIIPRLRGRHRSRTLGSIVEEVRSLSQQGIKEINLVAQDSSFYGFDLVKESLLPQLLNELNQIEGIRWIRVLYLYPKHTTDKILDAFVNNKKVVPYVDCPLQHINDRVLSHMKRRVTRKETENLIQRVRQRMPGGIFRTTFIVGYPTETDAEFNELKEFVRESRFERMGVFRYSYEPLTVSGKSEDQVPEDIKQKRRHELMILQQEISSQWLTSFRGKLVNVLVEGQDKNDSSIWVGRSALDAPEIDGQVLFQNAEGNIPAVGDIVRVQIQDSTEYDLIGVRTDESR